MVRKLLFFISLLISAHAQMPSPIAVPIVIPIVIFGGGIAGMTAALQISQAGLQPLVIVGPTPGGIITVSPDVENWPERSPSRAPT
jgi:heterodisulfide reductase subunit A-like polyferredoxin